MMPVHIPSMYRIGQRVQVVKKIPEANSWSDRWNDINMDRTLGQFGIIINAGPQTGFQVQLDNTRDSYWYPSCALELAMRQSSPVKKNVEAPRRVRVGDGPWNAAPCPHLRWHLMGFFREKLAIESTPVTITVDGKELTGKVAQVTVECPKCTKKMFLRATDLATEKK